MTDLKRVIGYFSDTAVIDGKELSWTHLYVSYPKDKAVGLAVEICKCKSSSVLEGVEVGDYVELYYDERKKVVLVQPVQPTDDDRLSFGDSVSIVED